MCKYIMFPQYRILVKAKLKRKVGRGFRPLTKAIAMLSGAIKPKLPKIWIINRRKGITIITILVKLFSNRIWQVIKDGISGVKRRFTHWAKHNEKVKLKQRKSEMKTTDQILKAREIAERKKKRQKKGGKKKGKSGRRKK